MKKIEKRGQQKKPKNKIIEYLKLRDEAFDKSTASILKKYIPKLNKVVKLLFPTEINVDWVDLKLTDDENSKLIFIRGFMNINVGDILFDLDNNIKIVVTEENLSEHKQALELIFDADRLETGTVQDLLDDIKSMLELAKDDVLDIKSIQEFPDPPSKTKH